MAPLSTITTLMGVCYVFTWAVCSSVHAHIKANPVQTKPAYYRQPLDPCFCFNWECIWSIQKRSGHVSISPKIGLHRAIWLTIVSLSVRPSDAIYRTRFVDTTPTLVLVKLTSDFVHMKDIEPWPHQGHVSVWADVFWGSRGLRASSLRETFVKRNLRIAIGSFWKATGILFRILIF